MGNTVMKGNARKVRPLAGGRVIAGFAGGTADAFHALRAVRDQARAIRQSHARRNRTRQGLADRPPPAPACQALLGVADKDNSFIVTGNGDVIEPENNLMAIGSGGPFAQAAAMALLRNTDLEARDIVERLSASPAISACIRISTSRSKNSDHVSNDPPRNRPGTGQAHRRPGRGQARCRDCTA